MGLRRQVSVLGFSAALSLIVSTTHAALDLTLFPNANQTGARCLDGSPAGFYANFNSSSADWVIYLEGGGLCVEVVDCLSRAKGPLGSSASWAATYGGGNNVLSSDSYNPFASFNRIYVPYCSGDTWVGNGTQRNHLMGNLYTSGHVIVRELINLLEANHNMNNARRVLLTGASAGGIGTFHNADFLTDRLPHAMVKAAPQSGWYMPHGVRVYLEYIANINIPLDRLFGWWVGGEFPPEYFNQQCAAANSGDKKECWDMPVQYPYVRTPLMIIENIYDANQIFSELLAPSKDKSSPKVQGFVSEFGSKMLPSLTDAVKKGKGDSYWMPSCLEHTSDLCLNGGPTVQGLSLADALSDWFFSDEQIRVVDDCTPSTSPCNAVCTCP